MTRFRTRSVAVLAAVAGLSLLVAAPAGAHPYFHGGEAPARSLATVTLDLAHGCAPGDGSAHDDADVPTVEVALELPDVVTHVEPHPMDGWDIEVETDGDGPDVVVWTAAGGEEPAPTFGLDLVVDHDPGTEVWFRVLQRCDEGAHRWVGTPDEPADEPAVRLVLTEPDPDRPPPEPVEEPAPEPDVPTEEPVDEPEPGDPDASADDGAETEDDGEALELARDPWEGLWTGILLAALAVAVLVALLIGVILRRRRADQAGPD